ncbi:MAG: molybdopterin molybdotransferase MoeA, partial [Parvularculaceae bacterium]
MQRMISVTEAKVAIRDALAPLPAEEIALETANARVLAAPVIARLTQPPFNASAMDGYAVRLADVREAGAVLTLAGVSAAGAGYRRALGPGDAVRIFTGAPVPEGADHILIQEEAEERSDNVVVKVGQHPTPFVRNSGIDFREGDVLLCAGMRLSSSALALAAAANVARVSVRARPRVAVIANGDELVMPGAFRGPDQITCSIQFGLSPLIEEWGAIPVFLGVAADSKQSIHRLAAKAESFDIVVPIGGASVGDHDFMREVFADLGYAPVFQGVSVRPGKPTWFG